MKLPGNKKKLDEIFRSAEAPEVSEFNGEYEVDMLTGLPSLKKISHRKKFYERDGKISGYNIVFKNLKWGRFFLEEGACEDMGSPRTINPVRRELSNGVKINYNRGENSFLTKHIRDFVRRVERDKLYLGRFYYKLGKKLLFLGYFSLKKIK